MKVENPWPDKDNSAPFSSSRHGRFARLHTFMKKLPGNVTVNWKQGPALLPTTPPLVMRGCFVFDERDMSVF